ncbi:hypothetical protein NMY22_g16887 [Coprinellus aureogranulatus]|nr:hypothetical protein NMY22_g16887 [Coprinellus aureogranulatus]
MPYSPYGCTTGSPPTPWNTATLLYALYVPCTTLSRRWIEPRGSSHQDEEHDERLGSAPLTFRLNDEAPHPLWDLRLLFYGGCGEAVAPILL